MSNMRPKAKRYFKMIFGIFDNVNKGKSIMIDMTL